MDKLDKISFVLGIILLVLTFLAFFFLGVDLGEKGQITRFIIKQSIVDTNCTNLSFQGTVYCLNDEFNDWFNYNESNTGKELTLSELKEQGGVCSHAAQYYVDSAKSLGLDASYVRFQGGQTDVGHAIALVYSTDGKEYCILDQYSIVGCKSLQ